MEAARLEHIPVRLWTWPRTRMSTRGVVYVLLLLLIANLVLAPLVMVLLSAINLGPTAHAAGATFDFFVQAWTSPTTWTVMSNTAIFAIGSTTLAVSIGVFFAFMVERTDM